MTIFDPSTWYWLASDGRVFSGPSQSVVTTDDAGYLGWLAAGNVASPWPIDTAGAQTIAAMQDALNPYGMFADLAAYAADARWRKEVGGMTINSVLYPTDRETQSKMGQAYLLAMADPTETFKWKLDNGSFTPEIDATTMQSVAKAVGLFVNDCYKTEETVVSGITAGTITTRAQVDAAFA